MYCRFIYIQIIVYIKFFNCKFNMQNFLYKRELFFSIGLYLLFKIIYINNFVN